MKYLKPIELYRKFLKSENGRLLGISLPKASFVAISDLDKKSAIELRKLGNSGNVGVTELNILQELISQGSALGMVICYPFTREWVLRPRPGMQGLRTKGFVDQLAQSGKLQGMNYTFWDLALKTKAVERDTVPLEIFGLDDHALLELRDYSSAWEILQGYLNFFDKNHDQSTFEGEHGHLCRDKKSQMDE